MEPSLANTMENTNNPLAVEQQHFLETTLGKTINFGLDLGIRALLPNLIEDGVIAIKDTILENGFQEGVKKAIDTVLNLGKSAIGVFTGNFENVEQIQEAVKKGGMIDSISQVLDFTLQKTQQKGLLNAQISKALKTGKNMILDTIEGQIENTLQMQVKEIDKLTTHIETWNQHFTDKNIEGMEKEYTQIQKSLKNLLPLENTLKEARKIENIHSLAKQKGKFSFDEIEMTLAEKLT